MDRPRSTHVWKAAFESMDTSADPTRRCVGGNWRMDHRVSVQREDKMLADSCLRGSVDEEEWWGQMHKYFSQAICLPASLGVTGAISAYAETFNANNLLSPRAIPGHDQLIHVASLNNMLWRLAGAEYATADLKLDFMDITDFALPQRPMGATAWDQAEFSRQVDQIAENILLKGPDKVRELAGLLCDTLGDTQPPWWACFAEEVRSYVDDGDWTALCRALGLGHLEAGHRLMTWRYEIGLAGPLYRPTVVDSNRNPFHFPSQPSSACGITMPLDESFPACREVLHQPLRGEAAAKSCTGELGKIADSPIVDYNKIVHLRKKHRERLEAECTEDRDRLWLQRHDKSA